MNLEFSHCNTAVATAMTLPFGEAMDVPVADLYKLVFDGSFGSESVEYTPVPLPVISGFILPSSDGPLLLDEFIVV